MTTNPNPGSPLVGVGEPKDLGASASPKPALVASDQAPSGLDPTGFDPARGLHILQHSLGVDQYGRGQQYRNHFATGEGSVDHPDCMALVSAGLMNVRRATAFMSGMDLFYVTDAGRAYVAENSPPPPKLTRAQQRYRHWLNVSDATGETFIEFCRRDSAPEQGS
jgi:hypothetical protein